MKPKCYNFSILGAPEVGKSNIASRFYQDTFNDDYDPTLEGIFTKPLALNGEKYLITVTDTAGQQKFKSLNYIWTEKKDGFIFVFDITRKDSYQTAIQRLSDIKKIATLKRIPCVLVGNKIDLHQDRRVKNHTALSKAEEFNAKYIETSAKDRVNIKELFDELIKQNERKSSRQSMSTNTSKGLVDIISDSCEEKCLLF